MLLLVRAAEAGTDHLVYKSFARIFFAQTGRKWRFSVKNQGGNVRFRTVTGQLLPRYCRMSGTIREMRQFLKGVDGGRGAKKDKQWLEPKIYNV